MVDRCIFSFLLCGLAAFCQAQDRLPTPDYHRQPGDPGWLAQVVQFHGHLGPSVVAGARMGMIGLRAVEARGYFDVEVTCEGPFAKPPQSCFLDGIQMATGATMGKRTLAWVQGEEIVVRVKNTRTGKSAEVRPTPALMDLLGAFKSKPMAGTGHGADERLEAIARKIAGMGEKEVVEVRVYKPGLRVPEEMERGMMTDPGEQMMRLRPRVDPFGPPLGIPRKADEPKK